MNGTDHYANANPLAGNKTLQTLQQRYRYLLDKTTPHAPARWAAWALLLVIYGLRTWYLKGSLSAAQLISFGWGNDDIHIHA